MYVAASGIAVGARLAGPGQEFDTEIIAENHNQFITFRLHLPIVAPWQNAEGIARQGNHTQRHIVSNPSGFEQSVQHGARFVKQPIAQFEGLPDRTLLSIFIQEFDRCIPGARGQNRLDHRAHPIHRFGNRSVSQRRYERVAEWPGVDRVTQRLPGGQSPRYLPEGVFLREQSQPTLVVALLTRIDAARNQFASEIASGAGFFEGYFGIGSEREPLLLPVPAVTEVPAFAAFGCDSRRKAVGIHPVCMRKALK